MKMPDLEDVDIMHDVVHYHRRRRVAAHYLKWPKSLDGYVYVPYYFYTTISNGKLFAASFTEKNLETHIRQARKEFE